MVIDKVLDNKKAFLDLLLLGDESEKMIDKYLERGDLFILYDGELVAVCVVTDEGEQVYEIKNLAVSEPFQRQGYASKMLSYIFDMYKEKGCEMLVGTGDVPDTLTFYEKCGFVYSHRIKDFFIDNYDHEIVENGIKLKDMVYLKKVLHKPDKN